MSHSHDRQEARNIRWQQRQREDSREQRNRQSEEQHTQGEHSGQQEFGGAGGGGGQMAEFYYNPRENQEGWNGPRNSNRNESNREWVSGTGQPPYRETRGGRFPSQGPGMGQPASRSNGDMGNSEEFRPYPPPRQSFAGRAPKGYKRSDERITEDINEAMTRAHDLDPSDVIIETRDGEVVLKGTVTDRDSKRRAEEIAESCAGVQDVQNQIRVKRETMPEPGKDRGHVSGEIKAEGKRPNGAS